MNVSSENRAQITHPVFPTSRESTPLKRGFFRNSPLIRGVSDSSEGVCYFHHPLRPDSFRDMYVSYINVEMKNLQSEHNISSAESIKGSVKSSFLEYISKIFVSATYYWGHKTVCICAQYIIPSKSGVLKRGAKRRTFSILA